MNSAAADSSPSSDELLRRALELAVEVAQLGQRVRPPLVIPAAMRPFLRFKKLPASALGAVRRAVDEDEDFRSRLARVATEEDLGAAGVLWLQRPEGWEAALAQLASDEAQQQERRVADKEERSAAKRLEAAEQAATRARAELAVAAEEAQREREQRRRSDESATAATAKLARLEAELETARAQLRRAREDATAARAALDAAEAAHRSVEADRAALATRLDEALAARTVAEAAVQNRVTGGDSNIDPEPPLVAATASSLRQAAEALAALAAGLGQSADALLASSTSGGAKQASPRRSARPTRRPLSIPGGIFLDAPEAVWHLVRVPDVVLVVDGYNVAKTAWPDLDLAHQRERLIDLLEDLVRRVGTRVNIVFDGADVPGASGGRRLVHLRFSPAGVSADDVIREYVNSLPVGQAVVVATSDQAVVASVRAMGANTVSSAQLLAALTR